MSPGHRMRQCRAKRARSPDGLSLSLTRLEPEQSSLPCHSFPGMEPSYVHPSFPVLSRFSSSPILPRTSTRSYTENLLVPADSHW